MQRVALFLMLPVLLAAPRLTYAAEVILHACAGTYVYPNSFPDQYCQNRSGPSSASEQHVLSGADGFGYVAEAEATVDYGWAKGTVESSVTRILEGFDEPSSLVDSAAFVLVQWSDTFRINNSALTGTVGTATASISLDALMAGPNETSIELHGGLHTNVDNYVLVDEFLNHQPTHVSATYGTQFDFTYGQPIDLFVSFLASSFIDPHSFQLNPNQGFGRATAVDFGHTLAWQGLSDVRDSSGNLATFTTSSLSGTDWALAAVVPLPGAVWFLGSALGVLGIARRRAAA